MKKCKRDIGQEMIDGLTELRDTLARGIPLEQRFDVRHVEIPDPAPYDAAAVRDTRLILRVSQPVFAQMLGVSPILVKAWEQGRRAPSPMARRLLDEINRDPARWSAMFHSVHIGATRSVRSSRLAKSHASNGRP